MNKNFLFLSLLILLVISCGEKENKDPLSPSTIQIQETLSSQIEKNLNVTSTIYRNDSTLWIYIPIKENIIALKGTKDGPIVIREVSETQTVRFIEGKFEEGNFIIDYEIGFTRSYPKSYGYASSYSNKFTAVQQGLYTVVNNILYDARMDSSADIPQFIYFVIADINIGIATESLLYLDDFKYISNAQEEFQKRIISDVRGHENIINDTEGKNLDLTPMTFPTFLAKQMASRINFKYTRSSFPPSDDGFQEVTKQIKTTLSLYNFTDYNTINIHNLENNVTTTLTHDDLKSIKTEGKLIKIQFTPHGI